MQIDEKTLRDLIQEELQAHQNTNELAVTRAYDQLASSLDTAIDLIEFLADQSEAEDRPEEVTELHGAFESLSQVISCVKNAIDNRSVKNRRSKFSIVK